MSDWWRGAVLYQIYPRSFQDSDGDGIGDLKGILRRLDHVAGLGADAIWISPFFASPQKDFGYDVSDYLAVDPLFGSLDDFDRVVTRAHALGLRVLIDQVWSHTSNRHAWFQESCAGGDTAEWYVWADARADGSPPNNWLSVFGGPAWNWDPRRRQYYLHHFLAAQPKLNLRHPAVLKALLRVGAFWLDRGVDGFRLDAVDFMMHDPALRDNPPRRSEGGGRPLKPFGLQEHLHDMAHPDTLATLAAIRGLTDRYPGRTTLAEISSEFDALTRAANYTGGAGARLHMAYTLRLMRQPFTAPAIVAAIAEVAAKIGEGWQCWAFSNHDVVRVASRWGDGKPAFARLAMALLLSLRGTACIYQGEELGLTEAALALEDLQDPYGLTFWPHFKGRDGCRTPMPWQAQARHGGFSTARPWLPMPPEHLTRAVDLQEADPHSVLAAWRHFLAWRKTQPALIEGDLRLVDLGADIVAFERACPAQRLLCAFNLGPEPLTVPLEAGWHPVEGHGFPVGARLEAWQAAFFGGEPGLKAPHRLIAFPLKRNPL